MVRGLRSLWRDRHWPMFDRLPMDRWVDGVGRLMRDFRDPRTFALEHRIHLDCAGVDQYRLRG